MKTVTAVLLGAGSRGRYIYGPYAEKHPDELKIVAVAEPNEERRQRIAEIHGIAPEYVYRSWEQAFEKGRIADVMIISTLDRLHYVPAMKALELGYHILLEKPMSPVAEECIRIEQAALAHRRVLTVSHVLRYSPFWSGIKRCIEAGEVGTIATIQHSEYVGYRHMTHSYVRGNWRNSDESSPMVLAKSCHDLDIISWLMDEPCVSVSSYGSLLHFREEHAPAGSAARCTDGCQVERSCPFSALKLYNQPPEHPWARYITSDLSPEGIMTALKEGPFGRCVYRCDNNVVDHQIVNMEFANGANANFTLSAFAEQEVRSVRIMGTKGEIIGNMEDGTYTLKRFATGERVEFHCGVAGDGHGGGDERMVADFLHLVREHQEEAMSSALTSATASLQSHLIAFASEESRLQGGMPVKLADMIGRVAAEARV
ncbi:Gfo/Idh/MocA family oxidoreductase [Paenibacillus dendritiformis]|uniref:Gfo/Idh/MocA family protein n=1 Tax=Paenibacillus dendritiformis TaxID=130049 RepID=UPI00105A950F|nr:Gfo/Idh/MocA family oxidoreductase [Paenibacillus dendritiformis]TDL48855.1 Gfo/Idh/MocA family oxidoreductase [Paenibacillus dendritiformis]WGU92291.1 Gfo/Idh/MocA family oxidoreductase [Paenibacillus dendritiformis]